MHDTVLKTLKGLAMETYTLRKHLSSSVVEEKVRYIQMICRRSSEQIREVIQGLRNGNEEGGIVSQLSRMLETWSKATGIGAEFILTGPDRNLPLMISCNLRNILSEALANIQKHAFASHVRVSVVTVASEMRVEIHDNGCGLVPAAESVYEFASCEKFGTLGMKERVEQYAL
ncbi:histidine kinase [Dehalococcoidia bacterium]|nr:histidine kinase [Dehalococcoidia bacterium]